MSASSSPPPPLAGGAAARSLNNAMTSRPLKRTARFLGDGGSDDEADLGYSSNKKNNNDSDSDQGLRSSRTKRRSWNDDSDEEYGAAAAARRSGKSKAASAKNKQSQKKTSAKRGSTRPNLAADIDRMFDDLERADDDLDLTLPPGLRERARAQDERNENINDLISAAAEPGKGVTDADTEKIGDGKKKPRKQAIVNEERLLGDRGLRRLKEYLKDFKIKGKGHEDDDLRRLINVYQLWAHQMLPQWAFQDVLIRTEAVCVKRGMKPLLRQWRDEASGKATKYSSDEEDGPRDGEAGGADAEAEGVGQAMYATSPSARSITSLQPGQKKKSYFDDIPTSSPGNGLGRRDAEMESDIADEDYDVLAAAQEAMAGPSHFEDPFAFGDEDDLDREAELAMMEMEREEEQRRQSRDKAPPATTIDATKGVTVSAAAPINTDTFDDFDFAEEEEIMREMEAAAQKSERRVESKDQSKMFYAEPSKSKKKTKTTKGTIRGRRLACGGVGDGLGGDYDSDVDSLDGDDDGGMLDYDELLDEADRFFHRKRWEYDGGDPPSDDSIFDEEDMDEPDLDYLMEQETMFNGKQHQQQHPSFTNRKAQAAGLLALTPPVLEAGMPQAARTSELNGEEQEEEEDLYS